MKYLDYLAQRYLHRINLSFIPRLRYQFKIQHLKESIVHREMEVEVSKFQIKILI